MKQRINDFRDFHIQVGITTNINLNCICLESYKASHNNIIMYICKISYSLHIDTFLHFKYFFLD